MQKEFRLQFKKYEKWYTDTIFHIDENEKKIDLSDCDGDSYAGDLEEWTIVKYDTIPEVIKLFSKSLKKVSKEELTKEQSDFYEDINNENVKELFLYLIPFSENGGNMSKFKDLLEENNIKYEYSAYRSSGSW